MWAAMWLSPNWGPTTALCGSPWATVATGAAIIAATAPIQ